jgi:4-hydroxy-tetrahydrodipicolinate reductase
MKIALLGYGKMGQTIEKIVVERGHQVIAKFNREEIDLKLLAQADVAIEFSVPQAAFSNIKACFHANTPVVTGTTGWLEHYKEAVALCHQQKGALLYASNFSLGVNLFFALNQQLAKLMSNFPAYQIRIHETHHTQKLDAPSGTAISLAEQILDHQPDLKKWELDQSKIRPTSIPINASRQNEVPGTHEVSYSSEIDTIDIKHTAHSRQGFALGAVLAAEYLQGKTGVYDMRDVLKLNL